MKITITVPDDLAPLVTEALESGEYENAEQIVLDGLWLWADLVSDAEEADENALADLAADDENLLRDMEARGRAR